MEELFSGTNGVVCLCKEITYTQIKDAMAEGITSIEEIMDKTEAGT
ncbi:MAG: (2Fe-2S)-binding protein, partial [Fusobacteriaceae bacterium]